MRIETLNRDTLPGAVETIRSLPEFFYERDLEHAERNYKEFVEGRLKDAVFLTVLENRDQTRGQVLGVLGAIRRCDTDGVYFLASFAVRRGLRGQGLGRQLIEAVESELKTRGARLVFAETTPSPYCAETRAFYEAVGYTCMAQVTDFWQDGDPLMLYGKRLKQPQ